MSTSKNQSSCDRYFDQWEKTKQIVKKKIIQKELARIAYHKSQAAPFVQFLLIQEVFEKKESAAIAQAMNRSARRAA